VTTTATAAHRQVALSPTRAPGSRRHASEEVYAAWVREFVPQPAARGERMSAYRRFVEQWPDLEDWFCAPLAERLGFTGHRVYANGRTAAHRAAGYLVYLALVGGVGHDFAYVLGRRYARILDPASGAAGYGIDLPLWESHVARLVQLGYPPTAARSRLTWGLGRLILTRGDPDLTAITTDDLYAAGREIRQFGAQEDFLDLRRALYPVRGSSITQDAGTTFVRTHLAKLHAVHVLLFNIGQVCEPPTVGTQRRPTWTDRLLPEPCASTIREPVERYLRIRLEAKFDRPQTVRLAREGLRRFVAWLTREHPDVTSLAQVDRSLMEEYLRWLPGCLNKHTGEPLAVTTLKHEVNAIGAFCRDTAIWGWTDVPGRPLISSRDTPRRPETLPRYLTTQEVDALMGAVEDLTDPLQRAALLLLRWSGARRDEIRRLTIDCLDHYPDGHPRLRIPVGKGHTERIIPLHPNAAATLEEVIARVKTQNPMARRDQTTGELAHYVFVRRGKLVSASNLFDDAFRIVCATAGLVDPRGQPTVSAHRLRHTMGTQLAEGGARLQTIMAVLGHKSTAMAMIYARISDPEVRRQYEAALTAGQRIAGPAAEALLRGEMSDEAVHWLQTNFLKTELELGHCLRLPAEGPCECDLALTCPKFLTTSEYTPRLRARLDREDQLITDAQQRGWHRDVERHQATKRRLEQLLHDLA